MGVALNARLSTDTKLTASQLCDEVVSAQAAESQNWGSCQGLPKPKPAFFPIPQSLFLGDLTALMPPKGHVAA